MLGWWFLSPGRWPSAAVGETLTSPEPADPKTPDGLRAVAHPFDALWYAPGKSSLARVRLGGRLVADDVVTAGTSLTVVAKLSEPGTTRLLRRYACRCVRETPLGDGRTTWDLLEDERSRRAVETAEAWWRGEADDAALREADAAAQAALLDKAAEAGRGPGECFAEHAAWATTHPIPGAGAYRASAAASLAVDDDHCDAARAWQRDTLLAMCEEALPLGADDA